jgi:high-affinity iron transporter
MLPTFVIGLREGLEAALIVGMIAAFCVRSGRRDTLRWVTLGVIAAVVLCTAVGVTLELIQQNLPQKQQEGLETVVGVVAVAMVTYMVIWMRRNARNLSRQLEGAASEALADGSAWALVIMAFLAVLREGFETAVFTIAAFNSAGNRAASGGGLILGLALAIALGYGVYRGGVTLNLSKFFRVTGLVLVLVAAGLVVSALHTAHEAGWLNLGQGETVNLSWLVAGGSVRAALLTGMLGLQPHPVTIELLGWLVYLIPVGLYVSWSPGRSVRWRSVRLVAGIGALASAVAALAFGLTAPSAPESRDGAPSALAGTLVTTDPVTKAAAQPVQIAGSQFSALTASSSPTGGSATFGLDAPNISFGRDVADRAQTLDGLQLVPGGTTTRGGTDTLVFTASQSGVAVADGLLGALPRSITVAQLRGAGGRLPLGITASALTDPLVLAYTDAITWTYFVEPDSGDVVDVQAVVVRTAGAKVGSSVVTVSVAANISVAGAPDAVDDAGATAAADRDAIAGARTRGTVLPWLFGGLALALGLLGTVAWRRGRTMHAARAPHVDVEQIVDALPAGNLQHH